MERPAIVTKYEIRLRLVDRWLMKRLGDLADNTAKAEYGQSQVRFECEDTEHRSADEMAKAIAEALNDDICERGYIVRSLTLYRMDKNPMTGKHTQPMPIWETNGIDQVQVSVGALESWGVPAPIPFDTPDPNRWPSAVIGSFVE